MNRRRSRSSGRFVRPDEREDDSTFDPHDLAWCASVIERSWLSIETARTIDAHLSQLVHDEPGVAMLLIEGYRRQPPPIDEGVVANDVAVRRVLDGLSTLHHDTQQDRRSWTAFFVLAACFVDVTRVAAIADRVLDGSKEVRDRFDAFFTEFNGAR